MLPFCCMQATVHSHIVFLEERIRQFQAQLEEPQRTTEERARTRSALHIAEMTLAHYRKACELEQQVRQGE